MRILIINQYFPPDASNTAYVLGELAEDLAAHHDVTVVAGRPSYNPESSTFRPRGVSVLRVRSAARSRGTLLGRAANYLSYLALALLRACTVRRPDVVVTMTDPPVAGLIGAVTAARYRRPLVHICHDLYPDIAVALGKAPGALLVGVWNALNRVVWSRAAAIVVVGRDMERKLRDAGVDPAKLSFIPTWSSVYDVDAAEVESIRRSMGWDGRFVVMHAGNMGLAQNVGMFSEVARRLRDRPEVTIVFVGDGAAKPRLVRAVEREGLANVAFLPYRPKREAQTLMAAADVHVVSLVPGLYGCAAPSKVYGIMAAGRPFIAAIDEGSEPALIVEEFGCGVRVPPADPDALAAAIARLHDDGLADMGRRARAALETRYERGTATRATRELLERVG